jgi:hypothetical protein
MHALLDLLDRSTPISAARWSRLISPTNVESVLPFSFIFSPYSASWPPFAVSGWALPVRSKAGAQRFVI